MQSPEEVVYRWQNAWNAADPDALAELFAHDAEFINVVGLWWHDRRSIRDAHQYGFTTIFPGSVIRMSTTRVRYLGPDAAVVHSRWHLSGQVAPTGEPAGRRQGIFSFVLHRRDDEWTTVSAHNTDVARGAETLLNSGNDAHTAVSYRARPFGSTDPRQE